MSNNTNTDNYEKLENIGRRIFYHTLSGDCDNILFTNYKFDNVDCFFTTKKKTKAVGEIKCRINHTSTEYDEEGHIFELPKYEALMNENKEYNLMPLYILIYNDYMIMWDVSQLTPKFETVENRFPKNTAENGEKTTKTVMYLKKDNAIAIRRIKQKSDDKQNC